MAVFYNQAQLSYQNNVVNSNTVSAELVEVLSLSKTPVVPTYQIGDSVTYVLTLVNSGTVPYTGLTVTDNLGSYVVGNTTATPLTYQVGSIRYYVNGVLQDAPTVTSTSPLVVSGIYVPANGNSTLIYQTTVNAYAPPASNGTVTNQATVSGPGLTNAQSALATISTAQTPLLSICKSVSPETVSENGQITYTFLIENTGNTEASGDVVMTDTFDPILQNLSVTYNGQPWTANTNYTYNTQTGAFATLAGQITVPAATATQDPATGLWSITPGTSTLRVTGTVS